MKPHQHPIKLMKPPFFLAKSHRYPTSAVALRDLPLLWRHVRRLLDRLGAEDHHADVAQRTALLLLPGGKPWYFLTGGTNHWRSYTMGLVIVYGLVG